MLIASVILIFSALTGLITIILIGTIPIDMAHFGSIAIFSLLSLIYASLFILIGMSCSIMLKRSTMSLIVAMTAWLFLAVMLPEGLNVMIKRSQNKPSDHEIANMLEEVDLGHIIDVLKFSKQNRDHDNLNDVEKDRLIEKLTEEFIEIGDRHAVKSQELLSYVLDLHRQRYHELQRMKWLSPPVLFRDIAEKSLYSGNYRFLDSLEQVRAFSIIFRDDVFDRYGVRRRDYRNASVMINGKWVTIGPEKIKFGYSGLEHSFKKPAMIDSLSIALIETGLLLFLSVCLGTWSFIGFIFCDIR